MKVLITGGTGQLGSHLASGLEKIKWIKLLIPDRKKLDIVDSDQVNMYFEKYLPDVVINAAAFTSVDAAEGSPIDCFSVNQKGAENLAKASAKIGSAIIQISTDYVFDGDTERAYIESDSPNPLNIYGASKLKGDQAIADSNSKYIILRTSWLFSERGKNFYSTILNLLKTKKSISIVTDQVGSPTYVLDLVNLIATILHTLNKYKTLDWGIYHYSGYPFASWFDFALKIQQAVSPIGDDCEIIGVNTEFYDSVAKRPSYSCLDSSKVCSNFNVSPSNWIYGLHHIAFNAKDN